MHLHHDKHHAAYVANLNAAGADYPELQAMTPEELIRNLDQVLEAICTKVRNNAGGDVNHTMFWEIMGPNEGKSLVAHWPRPLPPTSAPSRP